MPKRKEKDSQGTETASKPTRSPTRTSPKPIQINPQHVDTIVRSVVAKNNWKYKLDSLTPKWMSECDSQGISEASVTTAFEILEEIKRDGMGGKSCCGECESAQNKKKRKSYYGDTICNCPCSSCALHQDVGVPKSVCQIHDNLIPESLRERLKEELAVFENVSDDQKDWHPNSNQQVLDLVHPSLYCYVGKESQFKDTVNNKEDFDHDVTYQWLPTEFMVDGDGQVKNLSYINNIDEIKHAKLNKVICEILSLFHKPFNTFGDLCEKKFQVIVKAANIIVTPERCYYPGGTWHTEGLNENIVASGIYYYHAENIKESFLEFRENITDDEVEDIDNAQEAFNEFGLQPGDFMVRKLGSVETKQDRCIVFPNTYQHRVKHFFSADISKPAIRKILVFFLIDPNDPIISTTEIDVQRLDYLFNRYFSMIKLLPYHLVKYIIQFLPHLTLKQAKEHREKFMEERKYVVEEQNEEYEREFELREREFSLCEH